MKKELTYLNIEGSYGGDQEWFSYFSMRFGGCAAATACELLMYLAQNFEGCEELYPYDRNQLTRVEYNAFGKQMRPYLKPRKGGIDRLDTYIDGLSEYLSREAGEAGMLEFVEFDGNRPQQEAEDFLREQLERELPVPYLMLRHRDKAFDEITWHWFLLTGYEETPAGLQVVYATYGERYTADFGRLWNTGFTRRGGMVGIKVKGTMKNGV